MRARHHLIYSGQTRLDNPVFGALTPDRDSVTSGWRVARVQPLIFLLLLLLLLLLMLRCSACSVSIPRVSWTVSADMSPIFSRWIFTCHEVRALIWDSVWSQIRGRLKNERKKKPNDASSPCGVGRHCVTVTCVIGDSAVRGRDVMWGDVMWCCVFEALFYSSLWYKGCGDISGVSSVPLRGGTFTDSGCTEATGPLINRHDSVHLYTEAVHRSTRCGPLHRQFTILITDQQKQQLHWQVTGRDQHHFRLKSTK